MFTEQNCKDIGICLGMPEDKSEYFYHYYNGQGWVFNSGQPITNLKSAMWRWQKNGYNFKQKNKQRLLPIPGKHCSRRGCNMPAVYKRTSGAGYDFWDCAEHLPEKVKENYK